MSRNHVYNFERLTCERFPPLLMQPNSKKPFLDVTIATIILFIVVISIDLWYDKSFSTSPRIMSSLFLFSYISFVFYWRLKEAKHNSRFYEMLWGCNEAMLLASYGCFMGRPLIIGAAIMLIGLDQLCWYIDCIGYLLFGKFVIGVAGYMIDPKTSFVRQITTLHHLWFIPYCLYCLYPSYFHPFSFVLGYLCIVYLLIASRIFTPCNVWLPVNQSVKAFIKQDSKNKKQIIFSNDNLYFMDHLNINCSYECWHDIKISWLHYCNDKHVIMYIIFASFGMLILQIIPYYIVRIFSIMFLK